VHSPPQDLVAALAGHYALEELVGQGGMATVYRARDLKHGRNVAVKVLRPDLAAAIGTDRFLQEIRIAAQLQHPNVLPLLDSGTALDPTAQPPNRPTAYLYFVMPLVVGESLRSLLIRRRRLEPREALPIVREVADALSYAHRQGVLHRDIKPENILLSEGHAIVTDFGIAKAVITAGGQQLTRSGFPLGTPGYMSPEQAAGRADLGTTTDVFSLACVLYEMLIGETPGMWLEAEAVRLGRVADASPEHRERLDRLPGGLERALVKALAMRPELRYTSPADFVDAVEQGLAGGPRYREPEMRQIIERAAALEATEPTQGDDYAVSLGGLQRIGAEAGIRPTHVKDAAQAVAEPVEGLVPGGVLGIRSKVELQRILDARVGREDYALVLEEIRSTLGQMGQLEATLDDSFAWSSVPRSSGRRANVLVGPRADGTRIRISEDDVAPQAIIFAPLGAGSAVLVGIVGAILHNATGSDLAAALIGGAVGLTAFFSAWGGLRWLHRRQMEKRFKTLSGLLNRLEAIVLRRGHGSDVRRSDAGVKELKSG